MTETIFRDVALPPVRTLLDKLNDLLVPEEVEFRRVTFFDTVDYLRRAGYLWDTEEADEEDRGVPVWIGVASGAPLVPGQLGDSAALERWIGRLTFTATLPAGTSLGSVWATVAAAFELELRAHEDERKLILWLPTAFPVGS